MRLRIPSAEARPNGAGVSSSGLVERADGSGETCLGHVTEAAGLVFLHRQRTIIEDELSEKRNLLEAIQCGGLCFSKRFSASMRSISASTDRISLWAAA